MISLTNKLDVDLFVTNMEPIRAKAALSTSRRSTYRPHQIHHFLVEFALDRNATTSWDVVSFLNNIHNGKPYSLLQQVTFSQPLLISYHSMPPANKVNCSPDPPSNARDSRFFTSCMTWPNDAANGIDVNGANDSRFYKGSHRVLHCIKTPSLLRVV